MLAHRAQRIAINVLSDTMAVHLLLRALVVARVLAAIHVLLAIQPFQPVPQTAVLVL